MMIIFSSPLRSSATFLILIAPVSSFPYGKLPLCLSSPTNSKKEEARGKPLKRNHL